METAEVPTVVVTEVADGAVGAVAPVPAVTTASSAAPTTEAGAAATGEAASASTLVRSVSRKKSTKTKTKAAAAVDSAVAPTEGERAVGSAPTTSALSPVPSPSSSAQVNAPGASPGPPRSPSSVLGGTTVDVEPVPTCDCLEELLSYPHGALIFTQFLQSIGQPDTPLVFWFACMDYRKSGSTDRDIRRVQARQIYDTFLRPDAPNRISIRDRSLVENMEADLAWPSILLFDMVATAVMEELEQDLFPLFRSSKIYQAVTDSTLPRKPFVSKTTRIRARANTTIARRRRSTLNAPSTLATLRPEDITPELLHEEFDRSLRSLKRIEKVLVVTGLAVPRPPVPPEQLMQDLHLAPSDIASLPSTPRSTGSAPGALPSAASPPKAASNLQRNATAAAASSLRPGPTAATTSAETGGTWVARRAQLAEGTHAAAATVPQASADMVARHATVGGPLPSKAKRPPRTVNRGATTTTLALPSVGAASGDPSIGMRRTTASAPDMQNPPDLAASSSTMLLKPIQPAGRALRRFVLRGAAYDRLAEAWVNIPDQMLTKEMLGFRSQRLSMLTLNITREKISNKTRYGAILELVEHHRPDLVFLQEVTATFLQRLVERPAVRQSYYLTDAAGTNFGDRKCGQIIMSRLPFVELRTSELRSRNGLQAVVGVVIVNSRRIALSSVDLDDHPDDDILRSDQLTSIIGMIRGLQCDDVIIGGTFASDLSINQMVDLGLGQPYEDLWLKANAATHPTEHSLDSSTASGTTPHQRLMNVVANPGTRDAATAGRPAAAQDVEFNTLSVPTEAPRVRMPSVSQRVTAARMAARVHTNPDGTTTLVAGSRTNSDDIPDAKALGHTIDPTGNSIARTIFSVRPSYRRPDRLLLYSNHHHWNHVRSIQLVGTEPIAGHEDLWLSAHYGLLATIDVSSGISPSSSTHSGLHSGGASPHDAKPQAGTAAPAPPTSNPAAVALGSTAAATAPAPQPSAPPGPTPSAWERCTVM